MRKNTKSEARRTIAVLIVILISLLVVVGLSSENNTNTTPTAKPPTNTAAPLSTNTTVHTPTATIVQEPTATHTPTPITYYVLALANIRDCPQLDCNVVVTLNQGASMDVYDTESGASVSGSDLWYKFTYQGQTAYVHSSLVSETPPQQAVATTAPQQQNAQPPAQPQPTQPPEQPPAPAFTCDCSKSCGAMASCEEAYFQLNDCGCSRRDSDGDGVPCESICSGG